MKKGIIILIGIIIVCIAAFFVYESKESKTNTELKQTEPKEIEQKKDEQKTTVDVEKSGANTIAKELIPNPKEVSLKPGEERNVTLYLKLYDEKTTKENMFNLGADEIEFLSVKSRNEDVAEAKLMGNGQVKIIANESPSQKSTEIEVTYKNKKQNGELTRKIPVTIKDYDPDATKGLGGIWQSEKDRTYFYKIVEKGQNTIEVSAMALYETDYTALVNFTKIQKNILSGEPVYQSVYPGITLERASEFKLEKLSKDKIQFTDGNHTGTLVRASENTMEQERAKQVAPKSDSNSGANQPNDTKPEGNQKPNAEPPKRIRTVYDNSDSNSKIQVYVEFEKNSENKAMVRVEQRLNNEDGSLPSLTGMFETQATKQGESGWSFSWQDNTGTKGTGTIAINGENAIIELKSERNSSSEGKGIMPHKAQLPKIHQFEKPS